MDDSLVSYLEPDTICDSVDGDGIYWRAFGFQLAPRPTEVWAQPFGSPFSSWDIAEGM